MRPPSLSRKAAVTGLQPPKRMAFCVNAVRRRLSGQLIYDEDLLPVKLDTGGTSDVLRDVGASIDAAQSTEQCE